MLIAALGDLHLRWNAPTLRSDDFVAAQKRKLQDSFDICVEEGVKAILLPGDVFDRFTAPHGLVESFIPIFRRTAQQGILFFVVWGQHDQRYHTSEKKNTPLGVLVRALDPFMHEATEEPFIFKKDGVYIYGASWGQPIPEIQDADACHVLLTHKHVMDYRAGWEDEAAITVEDACREWPFDIIVAGDNHRQFSYTPVRGEDAAILVNAGSLMRQNIDQAAHKPALYLIDTDSLQVYREPLPIEQDVFTAPPASVPVESSERLDQFIAALQDRTAPTMNFKRNVHKALETAHLHPETKKVISEIMDSVEA